MRTTKDAKRDPHELFRGDFGGQKGAPNGPFSATKSLVYFGNREWGGSRKGVFK